MGHVLDGQLLLREWQAHLRLDERIVKTRVRGCAGRCGKEHMRGPGPVDRAKAHGARFTAAVNLAPGKLKMIQHAAGRAYRHNFSMGRRIKSCGNLIHAGGDDLSIFDHNRGKWPSATVYVINRQLNRFKNKFVTVHPAPCRSTFPCGSLARRASPEKSS